MDNVSIVSDFVFPRFLFIEFHFILDFIFPFPNLTLIGVIDIHWWVDMCEIRVFFFLHLIKSNLIGV